MLQHVYRSTAAWCAPENHEVGAHKRHGEGADITTDITGHILRMMITHDDVTRLWHTLDVLVAEADGGCNRHGFVFDRGDTRRAFDGY
jgi:hypothetical protein